MDGKRLAQSVSSFTNGDAAGGDSRSLSSEQRDRIQKAFNTLDTDADGRIEVLELRAASRILGVELEKEEVWDMLELLESMRGEAGKPLTCVNFTEFTRMVGEKLLQRNNSIQDPHLRQTVSSGASKPPEAIMQVVQVLEAAQLRTQSISEYYLQALQTEVSYQIETLVAKLQDENATVLRQLSSALSPTGGTSASLHEDGAPGMDLASQDGLEVVKVAPLSNGINPASASTTPTGCASPISMSPVGTSMATIVTPHGKVPLPPVIAEVADKPLPPEVEPAELHSQALLPGGVPEGSVGAHPSTELKVAEASEEHVRWKDEFSPPRSRGTWMSGYSRHSSPGRSSKKRPQRITESSAAEAVQETFQKLRVKGGRRTLRVKAMQAAISPNDDGLDETASEQGERRLERLQEEKDADRTVFADVNKLKEQVRSALVQNKYNVKDYYKTSGYAQMIAKSNSFEMITMMVVIANSAWIWVDADLNREPILAQAEAVFQVMEHLFCSYFVFEWLIRFVAFAKTKDAVKDPSFLFDSMLATLTVTETWILTIVYLLSTEGGKSTIGMDASILKLCRIMRLTRMARMARLLRYMPELVIILRGLWIASKSVLFTFILLLFTIFVFGIMFRQLTDGTPVGARYFTSVHGSMLSLFLHSTLPDFADMVMVLGAQNLALGLLLVVFILIATLTIMNMLVGVLVESVSTVSAIENETLMVSMVRAKMLQMIKVLNLDADGNGSLSKDEFEELLVMPEAAQFIQLVGVDVVGLVEYSDFIFKDREMSFADFVELILQLRGTNQATVKDIVDLRKQVMQEMEANQRQVLERFDSMNDDISRLLEMQLSQDTKDEKMLQLLEKAATPGPAAHLRLRRYPFIEKEPTSRQIGLPDNSSGASGKDQLPSSPPPWRSLAQCEV